MPDYFKERNGSKIFMKADLGEPCGDCNWVADYACDYPVGNSQTCDKKLCEDHAHRISDDIHYCYTHWKMWNEFIESGEADKFMKAEIIKMDNRPKKWQDLFD